MLVSSYPRCDEWWQAKEPKIIAGHEDITIFPTSNVGYCMNMLEFGMMPTLHVDVLFMSMLSTTVHRSRHISVLACDVRYTWSFKCPCS